MTSQSLNSGTCSNGTWRAISVARSFGSTAILQLSEWSFSRDAPCSFSPAPRMCVSWTLDSEQRRRLCRTTGDTTQIVSQSREAETCLRQCQIATLYAYSTCSRQTRLYLAHSSPELASLRPVKTAVGSRE